VMVVLFVVLSCLPGHRSIAVRPSYNNNEDKEMLK